MGVEIQSTFSFVTQALYNKTYFSSGIKWKFYSLSWLVWGTHVLMLCSRPLELNEDFNINSPFHFLIFCSCKTLKELPEGSYLVSDWNLAAYSLLKARCLFYRMLLSRRIAFNNYRDIFTDGITCRQKTKHFFKVTFWPSNSLLKWTGEWSVTPLHPDLLSNQKNSKPKSGVT